MRYLQVERADDFRLLAEENRINVRLLPPERGLIFDRNGVVLAGNEQNHRITLVREDTDDVDAVLDRLARIVNLDLGRWSARARDHAPPALRSRDRGRPAELGRAVGSPSTRPPCPA
jgi:penicillin-binding protein 2